MLFNTFASIFYISRLQYDEREYDAINSLQSRLHTFKFQYTKNNPPVGIE